MMTTADLRPVCACGGLACLMRHNGGHAARRDHDRPGGGLAAAGPGGRVTNEVIAWAGFAGAWLLVAGPIYQAAIELAAEDIERDAIQAASDSVAAPDRPSGWWWLVPPVGYLLWLRTRREHRRTVMASLTPAQMEQLVRFGNKATAWIYISGGAFLVALTETWVLREDYRWPVGVYVVVIVVMLAACAANTALRLKRTRDLVPESAWPPGQPRARREPAGRRQPARREPAGRRQPARREPAGRRELVRWPQTGPAPCHQDPRGGTGGCYGRGSRAQPAPRARGRHPAPAGPRAHASHGPRWPWADLDQGRIAHTLM